MGLIARGIAAAASLGAAAFILAACSSPDVLRPDIDVTHTAAFAPPPPTQPTVLEESAPEPDFANVPTAPPPEQPVDVASLRVLPPPPEDAPAEIPQSAPVVQAAITPGPGLQRLVPSNPYMNQEPEYRDRNAVPGSMPQSESDCRRELKRIGATFQNLPPVGDGNACGIDYPVKLSELSGDIGIKPAATLSCQMALQVAKWTKYELGPSTRRRYFTGVKNIHQGSSYSCRKIRGSRTMSEHSKGNALDIMRIELDSGRKIGVRKPGFFSFREKGLLNNVRADACGYFSTVLGPGYDRDHKDHFHFDIAQRRNGRKACR
jgi:hypothetical protein